MPLDQYEFTDRSYAALAKAAVNPLAAMHVLYVSHRLRRHLGSALQVVGLDQDQAWLSVALIEIEDDVYEVTGARYLDPGEYTNRLRRPNS